MYYNKILKKSYIRVLALIIIFLLLILILANINLVKNQGSNELNHNSNLVASYIDGEYQNEIPAKNDGYIVDKIVCDSGAMATWDNEEWGINIRNATQKIKCSIYFVFKTEYDFDYTGTEQVFTAPVSGTYKLETWGAQGATDSESYYGGYGGYSKGIIKLEKNDNLYVFIGGRGKNINTKTGTGTVYGYPNGGAVSTLGNDAHSITFSSGGGSTHIAKENKFISEISNLSASLLIVSGGGGGSCKWWNYGNNGGSAGGYKGTTTNINCPNAGIANNNPGAGTQLNGGTGGVNLDGFSSDTWLNGILGVGGGSNINYNHDEFINVSGGGGGGYYGGGASWGGSGAGGSGYIGNSLLTNKAMYCHNCEESSEESTKTISTTCAEETPTANCAKKGNGYARITYIGD